MGNLVHILSLMAATTPTWTLGEYMAKARRDAGVSTAEIADYFGVTRKTINNWESNRTQPSKADLRVWAERCGQSWFTVEAIPDLLIYDSAWITATLDQLTLAVA